MKDTFLSNRTNLTIIQCMLYFIIGYVMSSYLSLGQFIVLFIVMALLHIVTHIKAVADGMLYNELIHNHDIGLDKLLNKWRKQAEKNAKKNKKGK